MRILHKLEESQYLKATIRIDYFEFPHLDREIIGSQLFQDAFPHNN